MADTSIQWCDKVWNAVTGCDKVSQGCKHCYAEGVADRFFAKQYPPNPDGSPRKFTDVRCHPERLELPLIWKKPCRIFVNSMSDLFHEDVPFEFIDKLFAVMALCPQHTFQVLTKRPKRMLAWFNRPDKPDYSKTISNPCAWYVWGQVAPIQNSIRQRTENPFHWTEYAENDSVAPWPLPNVWLGVSVEDQKAADERIPLLLEVPAAVRWVSAEPLLGPIRLDQCAPYILNGDESNPGVMNAFNAMCHHPKTVKFAPEKEGNENGIRWVVCGGESGPGARPFDMAWAHSLRNQCKAAGASFFMKQVGSVPMESEEIWRGRALTRTLSAKNRNRVPDGFVPLKYQDSKGGDMSEFPVDLQVREFPEVKVTA